MFGPREEAARSRELGKTALREGDLSEARRHCEEAVGWQPGEMDNWTCLAEVLMETQAYTEVRNVFSQYYLQLQCTVHSVHCTV